MGRVGGFALLVLGTTPGAQAVVLWNDPDQILIHENGPGTDVLHGALKRDNAATDTLYFKFRVEPLSDKDTEDYLAAFELFEGSVERLGIGNALKAWAFSAFFHNSKSDETDELAPYLDLRTLSPEILTPGSTESYQYPRRGVSATIVFKVQYVPGEDDLITVWLNPDLGPGANESHQPEGLTTRFTANAAFDEIRLRHAGRGDGWKFSDLAVATSFSDFVDSSSSQPIANLEALPASIRTFDFQSWQKEQGLSQSPVRALAQTRNGYLFIGSEGGLARFDGVRFVSFGISEGLKPGGVNVVFEDTRGLLWIGGEAGLSSLENGRVTACTLPEWQTGKKVTAIAEDRERQLWVGTETGLLLRRESRFVPFAAARSFENHAIVALLKDSTGNLWTAVEEMGIFKFQDGAFLQPEGLQEQPLLKQPHCLMADNIGRIWVGGDDSIFCYESNRCPVYSVPRNQTRSQVRALGQEADGTVWAGLSAGGLLQWKNGKFISVPAGSGLAGNVVHAFLTDSEGNLWIGTDGGLNRLHRKALFTLSQPEGLGLGPVQGLAEVSPGVIWVAKPSDGLYRWDGRNFSRLRARDLSARGAEVTTLLAGHDGFVWAATTNGLLLYKDPVAAADEVSNIHGAPPHILSLAEAEDHTVCAGTREGTVWKLRGGTWQQATNLAQTNAITALRPDRDGSWWAGTDGNGLHHLTTTGAVTVTRVPGLSGKAVRALHVDSEGAVWIGTADQGLSRLRNGHVENFTGLYRLPDHVSEILEDEIGRLWLGSDQGIACIDKRVLGSGGATRAQQARLFRRPNGMAAEQCTDGFSPAGLKTTSGLLWFPTAQGVAAIDPKAIKVITVSPGIILEEVTVDGVPMAEFSPSSAGSPAKPGESFDRGALTSLRIGPGHHRVEFRYTALSFDAPDLIHFRYRLDGLDTDWVDAGTRRTAFYSYMPPGTYHFRIAAANDDGMWSESGAGLEVTVLRYFWQTRWFLAVAGISLMASVIGVVRGLEKAKLHRRLERLEQERALERERTRIAQDLHDQMGAKLCRISFLSEHARRGELRPEDMHEQITSISDASREVLHSLDEIVWAVNPQNDTLEHVASYIGQYSQDYFQMTGIECQLDIPTQLPPHPVTSQMRHHLFLATHEALTNILKHSGATLATIAMVSHDGAFEMRITDNGKGFDATRAALNSDGVSSGDGLMNMSKRLRDVGGRCWIESEPGKGTKIGFAIPLATFKNGH
jgi:ligand-binding sensor domain-containing protein/signal transduction histidine kinase